MPSPDWPRSARGAYRDGSMNTSESDPNLPSSTSTAPPRKLRIATGGAVLFAMLFPSLTAWIYFVVLAETATAAGGTSYLALGAYALSKVVQFTFPLIWVVLVERRRLRITRPKLAGLVLGLAFGLCVMAIIFVAYGAYLRSSPVLASTPERVLSRIKAFHADN